LTRHRRPPDLTFKCRYGSSGYYYAAGAADTRFSRTHCSGSKAHHVEGPEQVDPDNALESLKWHRPVAPHDARRGAYSGTIDQNGRGAVRGAARGQCLGRPHRARDIAMGENAAGLAGGRLAFFGIDVENGDASTLFASARAVAAPSPEPPPVTNTA
jgi:hypothetical protein